MKYKNQPNAKRTFDCFTKIFSNIQNFPDRLVKKRILLMGFSGCVKEYYKGRVIASHLSKKRVDSDQSLFSVLNPIICEENQFDFGQGGVATYIKLLGFDIGNGRFLVQAFIIFTNSALLLGYINSTGSIFIVF